MSTNPQSVNPVQDLVDLVVELQRRLDDLGPIRSRRVQREYDNTTTKVADTRTAIMALASVFERESKSG